jgi:cell division septation protein DedD
MTAPLDSTGNPYITDRRSDRRQRVLFSSVVISESNSGRILDISPKGLALQTDSALVGDAFPNFRFKFSPTLSWVEAKGRVVWRNNSKNMVGIEFIGLADEVHKQIRTWMDSKKELSGIGAVILGPAPVPVMASASATSVLVSPASNSVDLSAESQSPAATLTPVGDRTDTLDVGTTAIDVPGGNIDRRSRKAVWFVGLALVATVLVASFFLQRLHLRGLSNSKKSAEIAHVAPSPELPARPVPPTHLALPTKPAPSSKPVTPPQPVPPAKRSSVPSLNQKSSLNAPAFVLQVGAMVHEENANALAASLRAMNFPAFVMKLPTERFHHVLVGPYDSVDAATAVRKDLEKRGFQTIRSEWKVPSR